MQHCQKIMERESTHKSRQKSEDLELTLNRFTVVGLCHLLNAICHLVVLKITTSNLYIPFSMLFLKPDNDWGGWVHCSPMSSVCNMGLQFISNNSKHEAALYFKQLLLRRSLDGFQTAQTWSSLKVSMQTDLSKQNGSPKAGHNIESR